MGLRAIDSPGRKHTGDDRIMAVTISELVEVVGISEANLDERCADEHLDSISRFLDWRTTAPHLGLTETEIEDIEDGDRKNERKRLKTLQRWKRKFCFKATYRKLIEVFLCIGRADHAEEVCIILHSAFSGTWVGVNMQDIVWPA